MQRSNLKIGTDWMIVPYEKPTGMAPASNARCFICRRGINGRVNSQTCLCSYCFNLMQANRDVVDLIAGESRALARKLEAAKAKGKAE